MCELWRDTGKGFSQGYFRLEGMNEFDGVKIKVEIQNENLVARKESPNHEVNINLLWLQNVNAHLSGYLYQ